MARRVLVALVAALLPLAACPSPELQECTLRCGPGDVCPTAYHAVCGSDHYCHAEDKVQRLCRIPDGGADAPSDAAPLDGLFDLVSPPDADGGGVVDPFTRVTAGETHSCALRKSGALYCWGENTHGQLGDNSSVGKTVPTRIGSDSWLAIDGGNQHTCAIRADTTLWCWGWNDQGKLGSAGGDADHPRQVTLLAGPDTGWTSISAGYTHTCGVRQGALFCWGSNDNYRLGDPSGQPRPLPTAIAATLTDWTQVSAGGGHTCALRGSGLLYCWGSNGNGQVGDGTRNETPMPLAIGGFTDWSEVSLGGPWSCGVRQKQVYCWGDNGYYYNFSHQTPFPVDANLYHGLSSGGAHSCAIANTSSRLVCWGDNETGQIGVGTFDGALAPVAIDNNVWDAVAGGGVGHTCGIRGGALYCWGRNSEGQLGLGVTSDKRAPVNVRPGDKWLDVSAGHTHTCAVRDDNSLWCWGKNESGQVGSPPGIVMLPSPLQLANSDWEQVESGDTFTCGVRNVTGTRHLYCWGWNNGGQLGNGGAAGSYDPVQAAFNPPSLDKPGVVSPGSGHACGLLSGQLWCWGWNGYGQLAYMGMPDGTPHPLPLQVGSAGNWRGVDAFEVGTCGISATGLYCWGSWYMLSSVATPQQLDTSTTWATVSMGGYHVCGTWSDHTLHCQGANAFGQLGSSTDADWATVAAGYLHTCALRLPTGPNASQLWCWGWNEMGQLGLGNKTPGLPPSRVGTSTWSNLTVGRDHGCAIQLANKSLRCWGDNSFGQLGDGTSSVLLPAATK